jgi:hypothetical protein
MPDKIKGILTLTHHKENTTMAEEKSGSSIVSKLSSDIILGILISILAVGTAYASYLSSMSDSDQTKFNVLGMTKLTNANADYLTVNQEIGQDYNYYDSFYLNQDKPDVSEYYLYNFSEELTAGIERAGADTNEDADPFDEQYYTEKYAGPAGDFDLAEKSLKLAEDFNTRGDAFQLVVLIGSIGLAFAAFAAILPDGRWLRLGFTVLSIIILSYAAITWLQIPAPPTILPELLVP